MRYTLLYIACVITHFCFSQGYFHAFPHYDFINYNSNKITFKGDSTVLEPVFNKLDDIFFEGKGQVNIMQIGGSHVQAGIWTSTLRNRLQSIYPNSIAGRGLIFPYKTAKTTNPHDYHVSYHGYWKGCRNVERSRACLLGLMGISVTTYDSTAFIKIADRENHQKDYPFTRIKLFHSTNASSYSFYFPYDSNAVITTDVEKGYSIVEFSKPMDTLYFHLKKTAATQNHFICYGMRMETDIPGIYFDAIGNNGAAVPAYLRCDLLENHLSACPPDLVILAVGINDAYGPYGSFSKEDYKNNYRKLIARIKSVSPNCVVIFATNNDSYYKKKYVNKNGLLVKEAMEELSAELNTGIWDLFTIMGGLKSIDKWVYYGIAKTDRIHFNTDGYTLLGNLFSSAFLEQYNAHLKPQTKH